MARAVVVVVIKADARRMEAVLAAAQAKIPDRKTRR
jgi:hypothetical protein